MTFRFHRSIRASYQRQGMIFFLAQNCDAISAKTRRAMRKCCDEAGGIYADALWELLTTGTGYVAVSQKHHVSQETLYRCVKRFYEHFPTQVP